MVFGQNMARFVLYTFGLLWKQRGDGRVENVATSIGKFISGGGQGGALIRTIRSIFKQILMRQLTSSFIGTTMVAYPWIIHMLPRY